MVRKDHSGDPGKNDHKWKGQPEDGKRDEGRPRKDPSRPPPQRTTGNSKQRLHNKNQHGALQPVENRKDEGDFTKNREQRRQDQHQKGTRQNKQQPCRKSTLGAIHQPAEIGCQLLRFRPRQERTEIQRMQKPAIADPAPLIDKFTMHQSDLARRATKGQTSDPRPDGDCIPKRRQVCPGPFIRHNANSLSHAKSTCPKSVTVQTSSANSNIQIPETGIKQTRDKHI